MCLLLQLLILRAEISELGSFGNKNIIYWYLLRELLQLFLYRHNRNNLEIHGILLEHMDEETSRFTWKFYYYYNLYY